VEVDLKKGLPEAIKINVGNWNCIQKYDYEKIPLKCNVCHVYGHFAKTCPKERSPTKALVCKNKIRSVSISPKET